MGLAAQSNHLCDVTQTRDLPAIGTKSLRYLLQGLAVWQTALRDTRVASASSTGFRQGGFEQFAGIHRAVRRHGQQHGGRLIQRR